MFGFIKKNIYWIIKHLHDSHYSLVTSLTLSLNNQPYKARPTLVNINCNHSLFINLLSPSISVEGLVTLLMIHTLNFVFQKKQKI